MKYLKLTENQKQIIEFKNAQNSTVNVPIMFIEDGYYVAHELLGAKMYDTTHAYLFYRLQFRRPFYTYLQSLLSSPQASPPCFAPP